NAALDKAIALVSIEDRSKNIMVQFWLEQSKVAESPEFIKTPVHIFPGAKSDHGYQAADYPMVFRSPPLDSLKHNRLVRLESGDCMSPSDGRHTDASVSSKNLAAEICFSIGNLRRIPPTGLLREVLSLAIHEAVHVGGGDETEAQFWQDSFSKYFGNRFGDLTSDNVTTPTVKSIGEARLLLRHAKEIAAQNPNDPKVFGEVGKLNKVLSGLPFFADALAIELKANPPHPDLIQVYQNSVLALLSKIYYKFDFRNGQVRAGGLRIPFNLMPPEKVVPTLDEFLLDLETIEENFLAVLGTPSAKPKCVLPDQGFNFQTFSDNQRQNGMTTRIFMPERTCERR
ncbi:MAG: hypothetical protein AB7F86_16710, partial [Bdellovibrionales bacterium]